MTPIQKIEHELIDLKTQINKHPLYKTLETIEDVKIFMGIHQFLFQGLHQYKQMWTVVLVFHLPWLYCVRNVR